MLLAGRSPGQQVPRLAALVGRDQVAALLGAPAAQGCWVLRWRCNQADESTPCSGVACWLWQQAAVTRCKLQPARTAAVH